MTDALINTTELEFIIPGTPQQQGSKTRMPNGYMVEANKKLLPWRAEAIAAAQNAYHGPKIITPVRVTAQFWFPRPKSHFGTGRNARDLKPSAPTWHAQRPDLDKTLRALLDVLTQSGLIQDDSLVAEIAAEKRWTSHAPATAVRVTAAGER